MAKETDEKVRREFIELLLDKETDEKVRKAAIKNVDWGISDPNLVSVCDGGTYSSGYYTSIAGPSLMSIHDHPSHTASVIIGIIVIAIAIVVIWLFP